MTRKVDTRRSNPLKFNTYHVEFGNILRSSEEPFRYMPNSCDTPGAALRVPGQCVSPGTLSLHTPSSLRVKTLSRQPVSGCSTAQQTKHRMAAALGLDSLDPYSKRRVNWEPSRGGRVYWREVASGKPRRGRPLPFLHKRFRPNGAGCGLRETGARR